jgi:hypothetical protein
MFERDTKMEAAGSTDAELLCLTGPVSLYVPVVVTVCTASGHYMYHQFNIKQFYVLPTQCIYVFCVDLRTNSHYFPIQR